MRQLREQLDANALICSQISAYVMAERDTFSYQTCQTLLGEEEN